jgi:hypothetical protein
VSIALHASTLAAHLPDKHLYYFPITGHPGRIGQLIDLDLHDPSKHLFGNFAEHPTS